MPEPAQVSGLRDSKPAAVPAAAPVAAPAPEPPKAKAPVPPPAATQTTAPPVNARYGEAVVRQLLGATFIEEQVVVPRVVPMPRDD